MIKQIQAIVVLSLLACLTLTGCGKHEGAAHGGQAGGPIPTVTVIKVKPGETVEEEELTGRVEAIESVEIRPRVSGYLTEIRFQSGQLVKKGDVLFVIDQRPFKAALQRAEGEADAAKARFEWAEREAKRGEGLLASRALSQEESQTRGTKLSENRAAQTVAEGALTTARLNMDFTEVKSPIDGRVSRALVTVGNNVSGVDGATTLLTTVVSIDPIYVYADVNEAATLKIRGLLKSGKLGSNGKVKVNMALADEEGFPHEGEIESWDNRLDPGTGSMVLRTIYSNPDGRLVPGLFARLRLPSGEKKSGLFIPEGSVGTDLSQKFVLVVNATNGVDYRPIKLGGGLSGLREVKEGLTAEDRVVVNLLMAKVRPGMTVKPEEAAVPVADAKH